MSSPQPLAQVMKKQRLKGQVSVLKGVESEESVALDWELLWRGTRFSHR